MEVFGEEDGKKSPCLHRDCNKASLIPKEFTLYDVDYLACGCALIDIITGFVLSRNTLCFIASAKVLVQVILHVGAEGKR